MRCAALKALLERMRSSCGLKKASTGVVKAAVEKPRANCLELERLRPALA